MTAKSGRAPFGAGVDSILLGKAMVALLKHHEDTVSQSKTKKSLLPNADDVPVQVQLTLSRVPVNPSPKPIRLDIPHPFHKVPSSAMDENDDDDNNLEEAEVCLIVKDDAKAWIKELLEAAGPDSCLGCIKKVLGLESLRKKHSQFSDKRALLQKYDFFLADDRILPMLSKNLGKSFFRAKKQPIPINVTRKAGLPYAVDKCLKATWMFISAGTCITIKAGDTGMNTEKLRKNVESIISDAVMKVPKKWTNIQAISIKTSKSVALPIYNKTPEELEELAKLAESMEESTGKRTRDDDDNNVEKENKKKLKKELSSKNTLVKALKQSNEDEKPQKEKKKIRSSSIVDDNKDESIKKTPKKKQDGKKEKLEAIKAPSSKESQKETEKTPSKKSKNDKEKMKKTKPDKTSSEEKRSFIPSEKFKGSKKGYIYQAGKNGVGYYLDVPPVPDKMALAAFTRMPKRGGSTGKKRKNRRK